MFVSSWASGSAAATRGCRVMFKVLVLVCSSALAPMECQIETAEDVISGPAAGNEVMCGLHGQAYIAETALGERIGPDEYVKIKCIRSTEGDRNLESAEAIGQPR
jgi:hypothetical protein